MRRVLLLASGAAALAAACATLILLRHPLAAGFTATGSAVFLVALGAGRGDREPRRRFAERILERLLEAAVLVPLAWVARAGSNRDAILALVGLGGSYLASYQLAKGQALGYLGDEWMAYRRASQVMLVLALLTGWIEAWLWMFSALSLSAAALRAWNVALQERRATTGEGRTS